MEPEEMNLSQVRFAITANNAKLDAEWIAKIQRNPEPTEGDAPEVLLGKALYRRFYYLTTTTRADSELFV